MGKSTKAGPPVENRRRLWFFHLLLGVFVFAACEGIARFFFAAELFYLEKTRLIAIGEKPPVPSFQVAIGQAHLTYIPAPNYRNEYGVQHNAQGYRGKAVPMRRTPGVLRVLCLGGSTVYGWGVNRAEEAYPAQLERLLNKNMPQGIKGVEVINAGNPYATAAEMLTHYHFKFHYYKPDLVVVEAGGNDAEAFAWPFYEDPSWKRLIYHPDYSHWRKPLQLPQRPAVFTQALMRSRLASLLLIPLIYGLQPHLDTLQRQPASKPLAEWYEPPPGKAAPPFNIPEEEIALKHDLGSLLHEIAGDKARILLVPFRHAPKNNYPKLLIETIAFNEKIMRKMAVSEKIPMVAYPVDIISPGNWTDDCHLNAQGDKEKAAYMATHVRKLLLRETGSMPFEHHVHF